MEFTLFLSLHLFPQEDISSQEKNLQNEIDIEISLNSKKYGA